MATIKINDKTYELAQFSQEARQRLTALRYADRKLIELQRDLAMAQAARNVYASALMPLLPAPRQEAGATAEASKAKH